MDSEWLALNSSAISAHNVTGRDGFDVGKWISDRLGYQTSDHAVMYTTVYSLLFLLGLCGNLSTIVVVWLAHKKRGWTGIDAYLLNLAVTDLLLSLTGIPIEIFKYWQQYPWIFGEFLCSATSWLSELSLYASILTIVAFTFERYMAVKDPIKTFRSFSPTRTGKVIASVWVVAMINAIPYAHFASVNYLHDPWDRIIVESAWCGIHYTINAQVAPLLIYSSVCFYIAPMVVLAVFYIKIGFLLRKDIASVIVNELETDNIKVPDVRKPSIALSLFKSGTSFKSRKRVSIRHESKEAAIGRRRTVKVLLAIVANFFICYGLFHVQRLIFALVPDWKSQSQPVRDWSTNVYPISGFLYHANPVLDPIFYSMMSKRFQSFYARVFRCRFLSKANFPSAKLPSITRNSTQQCSQKSLHLQRQAPPHETPLAPIGSPEKLEYCAEVHISPTTLAPNNCLSYNMRV